MPMVTSRRCAPTMSCRCLWRVTVAYMSPVWAARCRDTLGPLERRLIPTGLRMQLPQGYECQIRPRSGLALKHGISLVNTPGTVDADYRGEIGIIAINLSSEPYTITPGERIAQMVIKEYVRVKWEPVKRIDETERGDGAFGHTGTN